MSLKNLQKCQILTSFNYSKMSTKGVVRLSMFEESNLTFSLSQKNLTFCTLLSEEGHVTQVIPDE